MSDVNAKAEAFFAEANRWQAELKALRDILRDCPVTEDFKWRSPCYTFEGRNVATIWGLKDACALSFFKGVLLKDPQGILTAPGENSRSVRMIRFTSLAEITLKEAILKDYIQEAVEAEKAGLKVDLPKDDLSYPEELLERLESDPALQTAFEALTPGRRRGYALHISGAKQSATRHARIDKHAPRILAGKGLHDR
ncbi:YdeI/OmpD-associated family protein [Roseibium aggregatum]|uniref:YdhG-like domain-containing protein n=1 Tax=Roseibium aggregatum TaxID=187304 RepID=A0A926NT66_9HYPH|nr:DUF1801 domain-containing protein [Roseibium aggregatum]MBD1545974.1 hypothetical protein [Roseibium aggregatum]